MKIILGIISILLIVGTVFLLSQTDLADVSIAPPETAGSDQWIKTENIIPDSSNQPISYVIDISVASIEELDDLLSRAENVSQKPNSSGASPGIALVLHGPEIEFFNIDNYGTYKTIVDRAAKLDAFNIIDVRMCEAMMTNMKITREQIPAFIELVPYGPTEVERLRSEGAVVL